MTALHPRLTAQRLPEAIAVPRAAGGQGEGRSGRARTFVLLLFALALLASCQPDGGGHWWVDCDGFLQAASCRGTT